MADSSDVQIALAELIAATLYPVGTVGVGGYGVAAAGGWSVAAAYGNPTALQLSAAGIKVRIYRGWPVAQQLDPDLAAGIAHVTVFQQNGMGRLAGGSLDPAQTFTGPPPTITATASGNVVMLGGTPTAGNLIGMKIDGVPVVYEVQASDTLLSIASSIADLISSPDLVDDSGNLLLNDDGGPFETGDVASIAPVSGGVAITLSTSAPVVVRVGSPGYTLRRPRQQTEQHTITCWAPTPAARDAICKYLDAGLSDIHWLRLADQQARLVWAGTVTNDVTSKAALWRRDLSYRITYWTTQLRLDPTMLFGVTDLTVGLQPTGLTRGGQAPAITTIS